MTSLDMNLEQLGDSLQAAVLLDHTSRRQERRRRRRVVVIALAVVVLLPVGVTLAATNLFKTPAQEATGLLDADATFAGTKPQCSAVAAREFRCVISGTPTGLTIEGSYVGTKVASVDSAHRIDGGCVATSSDGTTWTCYLGEAAVSHGMIDASLLGSLRESPAHG
jgi:hypothetical protein